MATGLGATFVRRAEDGAWTEDLDAPLALFNPAEPPSEGCHKFTPDYHACFTDELGGTFVVGGNFLGPLTEGVLLYYGPPISSAGL